MACFASASVTNRLPATYFIMSSKTGNYAGGDNAVFGVSAAVILFIFHTEHIVSASAFQATGRQQLGVCTFF